MPGGKPPSGPPPGDDGSGDGEGDEEEGDGLGPNLGQEAFAKMLMKLVKRAASDRPDEAWPWIMEVWPDREDKKRLLEELGEPGKFVTLDTRILAALTRPAKGDLAQRILTAKEECAKEGKATRGRQVLFMLDQYFKTSEEAGNLYSLEDLLRVSRHGEGIIDLKRFLNAWDSVIAGMKKPPEEKVLKDILLRQVRSCHLLRYDIDTYDRCRDDDPNKSYDFLMRCVRGLIERDRRRENRERVSKVNASKAPTPKAGAAAPEKKDPKKKSAPKPKDAEEKCCFDFQKGSCTGGPLRAPQRAARTLCDPWQTKFPQGKGDKAPCSFFAQEKCTR